MFSGGNGKLKERFEKYDLFDQSVKDRYKTNAAVFYRKQLKSQVEETPLDEEAPTYEEGREEAACNQKKNF